MREAIRRLLWLAPTLVVVTVLAFWAVSGALGDTQAWRARPLLFNPTPIGVRDIAWGAAQAVAEGGRESARAEATLARLGGAALPHVLPRLDSMSPEGRQRVARALAPLAARMDTAIEQTLKEGDTAAEFWIRFWEDHFVDFNPAIVKRVVTRYAQRATDLRHRELIRLDTFALDEIIRQMNERGGAEALAQRGRLMEAAAHVTGHPWVLPSGATLSQGDAINAQWQSWWAARRNDYVNVVGVERLLSPLLQTRYAAWVEESVRSKFGVLDNGEPAFNALKRRAPLSLALFFLGLVGGSVLGIFSGTAASLMPARVARWLEAALVLAVMGISVAMLSSGEVPEKASSRFAVAAVLMILFGAMLVARYQRTSSAALMKGEWVRAYRALGAGRLRVAWSTVRASSNLAVSAMAPHTSTLLSAVFVVEFALKLEGLGPATIAALSNREVEWIMLITLASTALVGVIQVISDLLLVGLDPRRRVLTGSEH